MSLNRYWQFFWAQNGAPANNPRAYVLAGVGAVRGG